MIFVAVLEKSCYAVWENRRSGVYWKRGKNVAKKKKETKEFSNKELFQILGIVAGCALLAVLVLVIGHKVQEKNSKKETENGTDSLETLGWHDFSEYFSKGLNEDGTVAGVTVSELVELCDYDSVTVPAGENAETYLTEYLLENCTVTDLESLRAAIEERLRFYAEYMYEYNEENYYAYWEEHQFADMYEAYGTTEEEYESYVKEEAAKEMRGWLIFQAIYEKEGLSVTEDHVLQWIEKNNFSADDLEGITYQHGEAYVNRMAMKQAVLDFLTK